MFVNRVKRNKEHLFLTSAGARHQLSIFYCNFYPGILNKHLCRAGQ
jgi:hypothetical protein